MKKQEGKVEICKHRELCEKKRKKKEKKVTRETNVKRMLKERR